MRTPWGASDAEYEFAPGRAVVFYTTPSHGGFKLRKTFNEMVAEPIRNDNGWYEEDCEWAAVAYTFPSLFVGRHSFGEDKDAIRAEALEVLRRWFPEKVEKLAEAAAV